MTPSAKLSAPLSLDLVLEEVAGQIAVFGRTHDVLGVNAAEAQILQAIKDGRRNDEAVDDSLRIVARIVPTLSEEERGRLTPKALGMITAVGLGLAARAETLLPNGDGPATSGALTPASSPA